VPTAKLNEVIGHDISYSHSRIARKPLLERAMGLVYRPPSPVISITASVRSLWQSAFTS